MRKVWKSIVVVLTCLLLLNTAAFASDGIMPLSSAYICGTHSDIIPEHGGKLLITFHLNSPAPMTTLGASAIEIYENNGQGARWIKTIYSTDPGYSNMIGSGMYYGSNITYTGKPGYKYYAKVYLTARNSTGFDTIPSTTPVVTAIR